jgi:hypothetical protein
VLERVDAEPIDIEFGDHVLVRGNEHVAGGELEATVRRHLTEISGDLLQREEVTHLTKCRSLAAKEAVVAELVREHRRFLGQLRVTLQIAGRHLPLLLARAIRSAPPDRMRKVLKRRLCAEALILEDVAHVIDDDVEDHVEATRMRFVDEILQVLFGAEAWVDLQ